MSIRIENISKTFGTFQALDRIDLMVREGSVTALLGPSGCGKTTLLRIIAGLEVADSGRILFGDEDVTHRHVRERQIGFMFQHYALFRHMNVFDNIAFGLTVLPRKKRPGKAAIRARVQELLKLVQLDWLENAFPQQLSGGQRQRIALARALATQPKLLLLDEPFGALDAKVRKELRLWLRDLYRRLGITVILVTHDQEEALEMADEIVLMNHGKIEQTGSGETLYEAPGSVFVTEFLGDTNRFPEGLIEDGSLALGGYRQSLPEYAAAGRQRAAVYVRPHELALSAVRTDNAAGIATITDVAAVGDRVRITLNSALSDRPLQAVLSPAEFRDRPFEPGQSVWFYPRRLTVFRQPDMVEYVI